MISVNLLVSLSTCNADKLDAPKLLKNKVKKRFNTWRRRISIRRSWKKTKTCNEVADDDVGGQEEEDAGGVETSIQSHMDSIHKTRKTIINEFGNRRRRRTGSLIVAAGNDGRPVKIRLPKL